MEFSPPYPTAKFELILAFQNINRTTKRVCIYPKDIQMITGKSYRQSTRILNETRKLFRKPAKSMVSVEEFCTYTGLNYEHVYKVLLD